MKMHNFTIRGNCLEIVGRIDRREGKNVPVYDVEFPEGVGGMSVQELRELFNRIKEDIDDLFYYYGGDIKNVSLRQFEEAWREGGEEDAHGA